MINMGDDIVTNGHSIHLALIPDGNRRYAKTNGEVPWNGHWKGAERIKDFVKWCLDYPEIKTISVFGLSTENLSRSKKEVEELWKVYKKQLEDILEDPVIKKNKVKVRVLGDESTWQPDIRDLAKEVINSTKRYSRHILNIMLAYGSKFELDTAVKKMLQKPIKNIDKFLMVKEPVDLVIRTGGQRRLSNFMLYQASYAELYFTDTLWPEFSRKEFDKIIDWYHTQKKNFGK